jgi:hypothetical protein
MLRVMLPPIAGLGQDQQSIARNKGANGYRVAPAWRTQLVSVFWKFELDGSWHVVRVDWEFWSGRRAVFLDEALMCEERRFIDFGSKHRFEYAGHDFLVVIDLTSVDALTRLTPSYVLMVDGIEIPKSPDNDSVTLLRAADADQEVNGQLLRPVTEHTFASENQLLRPLDKD